MIGERFRWNTSILDSSCPDSYTVAGERHLPVSGELAGLGESDVTAGLEVATRDFQPYGLRVILDRFEREDCLGSGTETLSRL
jgi:hypothetical protein